MRSRPIAVIACLSLLVGTVVALTGPSQAKPTGRFAYDYVVGRPPLSGVADPDVLLGSGGAKSSAAPSSQRTAASSGNDVQVNADNKAVPQQQFGSGEGWPANETSIAINPTDFRNVIGGANDYEAAVDSVMGIYTSFDGGKTWPYSRHTRQVITPDRSMYGTGDPVIAFDSQGTAYASFIAFGRANCDSYIAVIRSTDKGVTWSTPVDSVPAGSELLLGDGIVTHNAGAEDCQIFHDKEWMTAGPRPAGVPLVEGSDLAYVGPDRLYVTWTRFDFGPGGTSFVEAPIYVSYSDDQGRHWSTPAEINGSNPDICTTQFGDPEVDVCDENQFSVPVVDPATGAVYVAFENFNTSSTEFNNYLVVRSFDGGQSWEAPFFATEVADGVDKYPTCQGSQTLDLMCARTNAAGNIDVDPTTGDLYLAWADNRNGTAADTNTDVFVVSSSDGGETWTEEDQVSTSIDDQWFPWLSVNPNGLVVVTYFDRQYSPPKLIDTSISAFQRRAWTTRRVSDVSWDPDLAFRLGVFIGDYNGLDTNARAAIPFWTDARFGEPNTPGNNPPHQQSDVMVDVVPLPLR
jgi:hypothetical protein